MEFVPIIYRIKKSGTKYEQAYLNLPADVRKKLGNEEREIGLILFDFTEEVDVEKLKEIIDKSRAYNKLQDEVDQLKKDFFV